MGHTKAQACGRPPRRPGVGPARHRPAHRPPRRPGVAPARDRPAHRHDGGPTELTADALTAITLLQAHPELDPARIGLFGHSQGGWVVLEAAAARPDLAFVVTNSGPGVRPYAQERYAVEMGMRAAGESNGHIRAALERFDRMADLIRSGASHEAFGELATDPDLVRHSLVPTDPAILRLMRPWIDHDPRPALHRLRVPLLAIFGSEDRVVPVAHSLAVFRAALAGRPGALAELPIEGGDHRCRVGDPAALPEVYHERLTAWIVAHT